MSVTPNDASLTRSRLTVKRNQGCAVNISQHGSGACVLCRVWTTHLLVSFGTNDGTPSRLGDSWVQSSAVNREQTDSRDSAQLYLMCLGDRCLNRLTVVEDPASGTIDMTLWDQEQVQVSRNLNLILVMLTEDATLRIVQAVHDANGAKALRLMYRRYNP